MARIEPLYYYKWFWKDWRSNRRVQRMHYIARGFYRELLDEQFAEGSIPNDITSLAEICGCPVSVMKEYWPEIETHFEDNNEGGLVHPKMESVRTETDSVRVKNSKAGKASADKKRDVKSQTKQSLTFVEPCQPEEKRREDVEKRKVEQNTKPSTPVHLEPLGNPEVVTMVQKIITAHPRSILRKQRFGEETYIQTSSVIAAMHDEISASEGVCSPMECLEMILGQVESQAREVPAASYGFFKDLPNYFKLHEYRLEPSHFKREDKQNGSRTKGDRTMDALTRRIQARRSGDGLSAVRG